MSRSSEQFRNRYQIASANGLLLLSIPLKGGRRVSAPIDHIGIDYTHDWQRQHWGALFSAYGRAPFFEHYGPELEALIFRNYDHLQEFNLATIEWLNKAMRLDLKMEASEDDVTRRVSLIDEEKTEWPQYPQVFMERLGFLPDLSAIDLLMNEGPYAGRYLRSLR